jgi:AmmeMemoRadiSam system protein B
MLPTTLHPFPKLRAVDIRSHVQQGRAYYLLRDPLGLGEGALLVGQELGPALSLCDGSQEDARALQSTLLWQFGMRVEQAVIEELLAALDHSLLLENERSWAALTHKRESYRAAPFRPPTLAGLSYAETPTALRGQLRAYADHPLPPLPRIHPLPVNGARPQNGRLLPSTPAASLPGIFSPHIDYERGGPVYAAAWERARDAANAADLVVMVGTDHYGDDLFTLTRQSYATPFGELPTHTDLVDRLAGALGEEAAFRGELRHINEHSLELVAVWLHHVRGGRPVEVVPVLVGSLHEYYGNGSPESDPQVAAFLGTLGGELAGRNVFILASGDLAHVGPAFGGAALTPGAREKVRQADVQSLAGLMAGDGEAFFRAIAAIRNRHNVCGVTPGYLALKLMGQVQGQLTAYQSCPADEANRSAVTIAGVVFGG